MSFALSVILHNNSRITFIYQISSKESKEKKLSAMIEEEAMGELFDQQ